MIDKFKNFQAQIVPNPLSIEVVKAEGSYIYGKNKKYLDFVAGVSVCNIGHSNKKYFQSSFKSTKKILTCDGLWGICSRA